jgi:TonB-dependent receptor
LYSKFNDTELRNRMTFGLGGLDEATVTSEFAEYSEAEIERDTKDREQSAENLSISFGSESQLDTWLIKANVGYNYAKEETPDQVEAVWVAEFITGDNIPAGSPVLSLDHSNHQIPVVGSAFESLLYDDSLYELDEIEHGDEQNEDTQWSLRFDASRDTGFGSMQFGVKARLREKKTDEEVELWSNDDTWFLSDVPNPGGGDAYGFPQEMNPVPDTQGIRDILADGIGIEFEAFDSEIDSNVADFIFDEDVFSVYGMGTWENGPMVITAGIRVEWTELDSRGNIVNPVEEGDDGPDGNPVLEDTVFITAVQETNSYSDVLPSINLRYEFSEKLVGRASVHRAVVRPRVEEVALRAEIDGDEIELGNPLLDPFRAWNVDASLAYYPTDLSVLSAGVFWKTIEEFIFVQVIDDFEFVGRTFDEATIALNGDDADVFGIELNYQQHFGFLGAPWDAFLIAMNYTYVDTEATVDGRKVNLPKQSANIASFMLGYDKHSFQLRLAMSYRDRYIEELEGEGEDIYVDDHVQWDLTAKYQINENWQVYAEIANLGDRPEYKYSGRNTRLIQYDEFGTTTALGVQYNFQ